MTTDTITISKNALTELLVKFDLLIANTQIKKDVYVDEAQAMAITGFSTRKLYNLRKDRSVEWTANELGRDIKYSYKSLLKLKQWVQ